MVCASFHSSFTQDVADTSCDHLVFILPSLIFAIPFPLSELDAVAVALNARLVFSAAFAASGGSCTEARIMLAAMAIAPICFIFFLNINFLLLVMLSNVAKNISNFNMIFTESLHILSKMRTKCSTVKKDNKKSPIKSSFSGWT